MPVAFTFKASHDATYFKFVLLSHILCTCTPSVQGACTPTQTMPYAASTHNESESEMLELMLIKCFFAFDIQNVTWDARLIVFPLCKCRFFRSGIFHMHPTALPAVCLPAHRPARLIVCVTVSVTVCVTVFVTVSVTVPVTVSVTVSVTVYAHVLTSLSPIFIRSRF
jgi:hypothetical protein